MRSVKVLAATVAVALAGCAAAPMSSTSGSAVPSPRLGQPVTEAQLAKWNIDVRTPDGLGLPPGKGSVADGKKVYDAKCLACHGEGAKGGPVFGTMVGGIGSFKTNTRVLTPGSMYPYAGVLFDYVRRAMPMNAPQSLTDDESYAVSAYILHLNGLMPADAVGDAKSFTALVMPNRDNFIVDDRPDTQATRCMSNCPPISSTRK
jgi:cytochrome c